MEKKQTNYDDIIAWNHPISKKHPQMTLQDRAAQFAPFAALTGHHDAIQETARLTQRRVELSEEEKAQLDRSLFEILQDTNKNVFITYFVEDLQKEGGRYCTMVGQIKRVDERNHRLIFEDHTSIAIEDIYELRSVET